MRTLAPWGKFGNAFTVHGRRSSEDVHPVSKEGDYRDYAAACLELEQRAVDPDDKFRLLTIAEAWLKLADRVERAAEPAAQSRENPQIK